jgi:hypothetical protein
MLKFFILFIVGSVVSGVSFNLFNCNSEDITVTLTILMVLLDLHTEVPVNGYDFTNLIELLNFIVEANYIFELGCTDIDGVLLYAIKIGDMFYSVEPNIFKDLIFILF